MDKFDLIIALERELPKKNRLRQFDCAIQWELPCSSFEIIGTLTPIVHDTVAALSDFVFRISVRTLIIQELDLEINNPNFLDNVTATVNEFLAFQNFKDLLGRYILPYRKHYDSTAKRWVINGAIIDCEELILALSDPSIDSHRFYYSNLIHRLQDWDEYDPTRFQTSVD